MNYSPPPPISPMSTDAFEKTSWSWQLSQLQQQVGEWVEYQFSQVSLDLPNWSISPGLAQLLNLLFWLVLGLFLVWVVWQLWRLFRPYVYSWLAQRGNFDGAGLKIGSGELSSERWLMRSQEFYRQANYREACRCIYLAMLQQLHEKAITPVQHSRTDGEYLRLLRLSVNQIQPYETLITTHEQLCFGNVEIFRENYEQCQQAYREIFPE
jgi:hypothetical protein